MEIQNNKLNNGGIFDSIQMAFEVTQNFSDAIYKIVQGYFGNVATEKSNDPFIETKKKCLPETIDHLPMDERSYIRMQSTYYTCSPLTIAKRDGESFTGETMNNLIVDDNDRLIQLVFGVDPSKPIPPGQQLMQVIEYRKSGKTVARKFERYI